MEAWRDAFWLIDYLIIKDIWRKRKIIMEKSMKEKSLYKNDK